MPQHLRLISHKLCPYVQRAVIVAAEKGISFERIDIDLADKPDWFLAISPTGKVPLLEVTDEDGVVHILFESAVIAEYLDEISGNPLLPADPLERARERAWIEFASATLADIGKLYSATDAAGFNGARFGLEQRFEQLEQEVAGPWFAGERFGLADAAFAPAFRYIDLFERWADSNLVKRLPRTLAWSRALKARASVINAVPADYENRLFTFVARKNSYLAKLISDRILAAA